MGTRQTISTMFGPSVPREVALGFAISIKNEARGLNLFGSPHEILNELRVRGVEAGQLIVELDTAIAACEVFKQMPEMSFSAGPHAATIMELLDAVARTDLARVQQLLEKDPEAIAADHDGAQLPLLSAVCRGAEEQAKLLLASGARVDARSQFEMSPLHWSAARGDNPICQVLLDAGADPRRQSWFFATPAELALLNGHLATARLVSRRIAPPPEPFTEHVAIERMQSRGS